MTTPGDIVFWVALIVYFGASQTLAYYLGDLRSSGKAPKAPTTGHMMWGHWGTAGLGFVVSGEHRKLKDRFTSILVWIIRGALAVLIAAIVVNLSRG